ncbi:MAG: YjgP/YjgQ family permease [Planctomycetes bacterium]|jgi:lipopolysaccharide export LptBFGC system permease protein LptF|nr:YjgP/YjgQ family permease [Planctomycetota bacterium]MBT4028015.1 YjgP/YjgQ family permease [Planctomycetota bacterium]MBT4561095.1 YjgP/YjgQ family permease [Planctomycetota bacterium]MBT5120564.1 YjgP/YjgQ family permease [Planctomycetota bacterium]MBT7012289.1 YjgP/YjgQ family permease [Planctomycetota bacterium]
MRGQSILVLTERSYFREIVQHLLFVLLGVIFLVALGAVVRASATSQGAPIWVSLSLIPLMVGNALPYFFPMALLTAIVLTYGRMASDGELVALLASGQPPMRLLRPALWAGVLMMLVAYPLTSLVVPEIYGKMRDIMRRMDLAALENTNPSSSSMHFRGLDLTWTARNPDGAFLDVVLFLRSPSQASAVGKKGQPNLLRVRANRASMDFEGGELVFSLDGMRTWSEQQSEQGGAGWTVAAPNRTYLRVDVQQLGNRLPPVSFVKNRSSFEIQKAIREDDSLSERKREEYRFVLWERIAQAMSFLPIALVGGLLGWWLRRAGFLSGFAAGLGVLALVFYPLYYFGRAQVNAGTMPAIPAAFLPVLGLAPLLWFLLRRRSS